MLLFCGHHDSGTDVEGVQSGSTIFGALNFCISAGDTILQTTALTHPLKYIQNQIITILGDHIHGIILRRVHNSLCYTLIADEVTDCSNKEQLCMVLRYVELWSSWSARTLLLFWNVTVALLIKWSLGWQEAWFPDSSKICGQAYDGASNMSDKTNGAAIPEGYKNTHCIHVLIYKKLQQAPIYMYMY